MRSSEPSARREAPQGAWQGHALTTRYVLEPLLLRYAAEEDPLISHNERLLFNACEFWAATAHRNLGDHLGRAPHWRLSMALDALEGCGGIGIARIVKRQVSALPVRPSRAAVQRAACAIETELLPMAADIDALLARFAHRIMTEEKSGVPLAHVHPKLESTRARTPGPQPTEHFTKARSR